MLVGLHTTRSAPQAKNPSYAPVLEMLQLLTMSSCVNFGSSGVCNVAMCAVFQRYTGVRLEGQVFEYTVQDCFTKLYKFIKLQPF